MTDQIKTIGQWNLYIRPYGGNKLEVWTCLRMGCLHSPDDHDLGSGECFGRYWEGSTLVTQHRWWHGLVGIKRPAQDVIREAVEWMQERAEIAKLNTQALAEAQSYVNQLTEKQV